MRVHDEPSAFPVSAAQSLSFGSQLAISSIWLKAFELLSIQQILFFFTPPPTFSSPCLFIYLFLEQGAGLARSSSLAISPRCALPSCCSALIKGAARRVTQVHAEPRKIQVLFIYLLIYLFWLSHTHIHDLLFAIIVLCGCRNYEMGAENHSVVL